MLKKVITTSLCILIGQNESKFVVKHILKQPHLIMNKRKIIDKTSDASAPKKSKPAHWSMGLMESVSDPKYLVKSDDKVYVIRDKYPKAKHHYLIIPKEHITRLKSVTEKHAPLLKHMEDIALEIIGSKEHENDNFKLGYHAVPSMTKLHLHVISDDMCSDCLKTKRHWNSFTTGFFLDSEDVRKNLKKNGQVALPTKEACDKYMQTPLKCHKCDVKPKNMPELKKHILIHLKK